MANTTYWKRRALAKVLLTGGLLLFLTVAIGPAYGQGPDIPEGLGQVSPPAVPALPVGTKRPPTEPQTDAGAIPPSGSATQAPVQLELYYNQKCRECQAAVGRFVEKVVNNDSISVKTWDLKNPAKADVVKAGLAKAKASGQQDVSLLVLSNQREPLVADEKFLHDGLESLLTLYLPTTFSVFFDNTCEQCRAGYAALSKSLLQHVPNVKPMHFDMNEPGAAAVITPLVDNARAAYPKWKRLIVAHVPETGQFLVQDHSVLHNLAKHPALVGRLNLNARLKPWAVPHPTPSPAADSVATQPIVNETTPMDVSENPKSSPKRGRGGSGSDFMTLVTFSLTLVNTLLIGGVLFLSLSKMTK